MYGTITISIYNQDTGYGLYTVKANVCPPYDDRIPDTHWDTKEETLEAIRKIMEGKRNG